MENHLLMFAFFETGTKKKKRFIRASLPFGHSGTHVVLQVRALHPVRPHATEPEDGPLRLLLQPASLTPARSAAL